MSSPAAVGIRTAARSRFSVFGVRYEYLRGAIIVLCSMSIILNLGELLGMVEVECSRRHFDCVGRLTFILSQTFYNISESSRC